MPLALASILTGGFLAAAAGRFNGPVVALAALTTVLLQILSNLANDYGDSQNGADSVHRQGPLRAVQSGAITAAQMLRAMWGFGAAALLSGLVLLAVALGTTGGLVVLGFFILGLAAILGRGKLYGRYKPLRLRRAGGLGGVRFLRAGGRWRHVLFANPQPARGRAAAGRRAGLLRHGGAETSTNIRDIASDKMAGKITVPVRLGPRRARGYHGLLLAGGRGLRGGVRGPHLPLGLAVGCFALSLPLFVFQRGPRLPPGRSRPASTRCSSKWR